MAVSFEGYERRIDKINKTLAEYGIADLEEALKICTDLGFNPYDITEDIQSIAFENAKWAYTLGCAIAVKKGVANASDAAAAIGIGLQAFCVPGSVAEDRKVGLGHGNLGAMLLGEDTECFAFLAGHESFAAAEGAIGIANNANKARTKPLRVILNGLGKGLRSMVGTTYGTAAKGARYLELTQGYITQLALNDNNEIIGFEYVNLGVLADLLKKDVDAKEAMAKATGRYGQWDAPAKTIDPRKE